jgi:hypothetical protein
VIPIELSERALAAGLSNGPDSAHTSKTMMLPELRALLAATSPGASLHEYRVAAVEGNAMSKRTAATRAKTLYYLRKLYTLDRTLPVFAALRALWDVDDRAQPLIALACAVGRDPGLRATADPVLGLAVGQRTGPAELADAIEDALPDRFNPSVRHHMGQNAGATWAQAGVLRGVMSKTRSRPEVTYPAVVFALYLGHLEGWAGPSLFATLWVRLLDTPQATVRALMEPAARAGWVDLRSAGGMLDITFSHLDSLTAPRVP